MKHKLTIITTTINSPTTATLKFAKIASEKNFLFVVVGDTKTPHHLYKDLEVKYDGNFKYLTPEEQDALFPELSEAIGWKTIQRRNIGFVYAYNYTDSPVIATVDDDNIPYDNWGDNIFVGQDVVYDEYKNKACAYFDPLSVTKDNHVWHRGYPIEHLQVRHDNDFLGRNTKKCLVQAMLWDGDPDIDAMARLTFKPCMNYDYVMKPFGSMQPAPFNSQNTFLAREVIPSYAVLPFVGRMDDIWGSYILQALFPNCVVYDVPTVYQDRNQQDLITNLENEIVGYRGTLKFINAGVNFEELLPEKTKVFWNLYKSAFKFD